MPDVRGNPWAHIALKGLSDAEFDALDGVELGAAAYAGTTLTTSVGGTVVTDVIDIKNQIDEMIDTQADDDNPFRPVGGAAVVHDKSFEDWTCAMLYRVRVGSTLGFTQDPNNSTGTTRAWIAYLEIDGIKLTALVQLFNGTRVPGSRFQRRISLRNCSKVIPYWSAV